MSDLEPAQPPQPTPGGGITGGHSMPVVAMLLVILGGAAMIVAAFLPWAQPHLSVRGTDLGVDVFWSAEPAAHPGFVASAGFVVVIIGAIALLGLVPGARAFGVLGGILGMLAALLVAVSAFRSRLDFEHLRLGLFLLFVGGLVALAGSVIPTGRPPAEAEPPRGPETEAPPPA